MLQAGFVTRNPSAPKTFALPGMDQWRYLPLAETLQVSTCVIREGFYYNRLHVGSARRQAYPLLRRPRLPSLCRHMPDNLAFHQIDDEFGDIRSMVGDPLVILTDEREASRSRDGS